MDDFDLEVIVERLKATGELKRDVTTPSIIEINGPANIVMLVDSIRQSSFSSEAALDLIRAYAERTMRYMLAHNADASITWGDVQ